MFKNVKERAQKGFNTVESKISNIITKCKLETDSTISVCSTKASTILIDSISSLETLFSKKYVSADFGFVLFNELRNKNPKKTIKLSDDNSVIVDYDGCELIMTIYKKDKDVIINVVFGNENVAFKYDFNKVIDVITNDKPIREMGEIIAITNETTDEYQDGVACTTSNIKHEDNLVKENIGSMLFEDGNGINIQISNDLYQNIIRPEIYEDNQTEISELHEDNVFVIYKKKKENEELLKEMISKFENNNIDQDENNIQQNQYDIYQQYAEYGWY